ncbi:hypothetical protein HaLaN_20388 [Haematococcus lacustris]|uniref:Uncharacterized protein n=1 Tax=Haematococcus lacustris TaxID=44745 RepID=A0A699ZVT6_HAELA|nr:hypothetical protein HaLaN_20388 [Haematococcus lacustris]
MELSICNEDSQDVTLQSFNLLRRRPEISVTDVLGMGPPGVAQVLQPSAATSLTITVVVSPWSKFGVET